MNYIKELKYDKNFNLYAKFENGKVFHKVQVLNAPNFCGMSFKVFKRHITNYNNIYDFALILRKLLKSPISYEIYRRIKIQLESLNYGIVTHKDSNIF